MKTFEWFVALRYLRARRKQTVISVVTVISVLGVAAGVAAMIVALSISAGFRESLQDKLLKGTAHINVKPVLGSEGIEDHAKLVEKIGAIPGIHSASAALYGPVLISTGVRQDGVMLKGIAVDDPLVLAQFFEIRQGDLRQLADDGDNPVRDRVAIGVDLSENLGLFVGIPSVYSATRQPCPPWANFP